MKIGWHDVWRSVFVVAEIGINHNGNPDLAYQLQEAAAKAGANAVKYQVGTPREYVNPAEWDKPRQLESGEIVPYIEYRERMELEPSVLDDLRGHAEDLGLVWFASPLDVGAVDTLEHIGTPAYKVASPKLTDDALLVRLAQTGKPVILSSGMTTLEQLDAAVNLLDWENIGVLHCTSVYPCPPELNNLRMIQTLRLRFPNRPVGYSGHEKGIPESIGAVALGARIVERHFTLDRAMWGSDQGASLEPEAMRQMVRYIRTVERALGDGSKQVYAEESRNMHKFRLTG